MDNNDNALLRSFINVDCPEKDSDFTKVEFMIRDSSVAPQSDEPFEPDSLFRPYNKIDLKFPLGHNSEKILTAKRFLVRIRLFFNELLLSDVFIVPLVLCDTVDGVVGADNVFRADSLIEWFANP